MDIVILGTGSIGASLATAIRLADPIGAHTIHLVGRPRIVDKIRDDGLIFVPYGTQSNSEWISSQGYQTYHSITDVPRADVIFLTVKAHGLESALREAEPLIKVHSPFLVITMNGLGLREIASLFSPDEKIIEAISILPSRIEGNKVINTGGNAFVVVEDTVAAREILPQIVPTGGTIEFRLDPSFRVTQWKKAVLNSGINSLAAITMMTVGEVLETEPLGHIIKQVIVEIQAVAKAMAISFDKDLVEMFWAIASKDPTHRPSTQQDVRRGNPTEIDFLNGYIAKKGAELGIPTPANQAITALMHIVEGRT